MAETKKKRKSSISPTQLSLKHMRDWGCKAQVVEKWNPHARVRQDLFGVIDIVCIGDGNITGIQATSRSNMSARVAKIRSSSDAVDWCLSHGVLLVHGWDKHNNRWRLKSVRMKFIAESRQWIEIPDGEHGGEEGVSDD